MAKAEASGLFAFAGSSRAVKAALQPLTEGLKATPLFLLVGVATPGRRSARRQGERERRAQWLTRATRTW